MPQTSDDSKQRTEHVVQHPGNKPYKCTVCKYSCILMKDMVKHLWVHSGNKPYKCGDCDYASKQSSSLYAHMKRVHPNVKPFQCSVCGKAFTRPIRLRQHLQRHTGENVFRCSLCDCSFSRSAYLSQHLRSHDTIKRFKCTVCDYAAAQSHHLRGHMVSKHPGIALFKCSVCDDGFMTSSHLKRHLRTVHKCMNKNRESVVSRRYPIATGELYMASNVGPDGCRASGDSPTVLSESTVASASLSGDQPKFQCDVCGKPFITEAMLSRHLRQVHINNCLTKNRCEILPAGRKMTQSEARMCLVPTLEVVLNSCSVPYGNI